MDKLNVAQTYNELSFSLKKKKEILKLALTWMNVGLEEGWNGGLLFHDYRASVWEDEKIQKTDSGDVWTTMWMYLMPQNWTLKNG